MEFTEDDIKNKLNFLEIEEEKLAYNAYKLEKSDEGTYILIGDAFFGEELYKDFKIEVKLSEDIEIKNAKEILELDWEWYDFIFN